MELGMAYLGLCPYCRKARATNTDHLITRAQAKRLPRARLERENPRFKVPSCHTCNVNKGSRLRVPPGYEHLIPELEAITLGKYAVMDGIESLREVMK